MLLDVFFRGLLLGFIASIPSVGPVGVLCIQRTLSKNQKSGFISGLGAVAADTIYATVALFSLTMVISFIQNHINTVQVVGGICVMCIGVYIFLSNPVMQIRRNRAGKGNLWQDFLSVFVITIANPILILYFVPMFAAFGLSKEMGLLNAVSILVGVFAGGALWWLLITGLISLLRKKFRPRHLLWVNRIAGALIIILGGFVIVGTLFNFHIDEILQ